MLISDTNDKAPPQYYHVANQLMIIDDEKDLLFVYKSGLVIDGIEIVTFDDPTLALEEFSKNSEKYCIVITDLRMPIMSGYEIINKFKTINPQIKVIMISAYNITESEICQNLNPHIKIDRLIRKPVTLEDIRRMIEDMWNIYKNNR
ncbi:MAG TPA: response regulator [Candidatus Nitrosocosmicus sp.]|nr:response regulator [Candidatus Nitrosocosmicus sp.]